MRKLSDFKIETNIVSVREDVSMAEAVDLFIKKEVSSVLVTNKEGKVIGILTERDIVRKFTLVEVKDKLTRTVGTVMGRGVKFVSPDSILDDVIHLHFEHGVRHFPVSKSQTPDIGEVEGIVSVSDILRTFLKERANKNIEERRIAIPIKIAVLTKSEALFQSHVSTFEGFPVALFRVQSMNAHIREHGVEKFQLLADLDGFNQKELQEIIPLLGQYRGNKILVMTQPALVTLLQKMISTNDKQVKVCMKPIDATYCNWLFTEKWRPTK